MGKYIFLLSSFIILLTNVIRGQSHGLQFSSHEVVPEKRTSLNLTPAEPLCLHNTTELSFDLNFRPDLETYFGYILRIITTANQNIDIVYNQKLRVFNFIIGEAFSFPFSIDSARLHGQWNTMKIQLDEKKKTIAFFLNSKELCREETDFSGELCCRIYFGVNNYTGFQTMDIPPMRIKDIRITEDNTLVDYYPLSESEGNQAVENISKKVVAVKNPVWIKPRHQNWEQVLSLTTASTPGMAFDSKREILYITGLDSLYTFSLRNLTLTSQQLAKSRDFLPPGNQSVYNAADGKLYNFYTDEKLVSSYDTLLHLWSKNFPVAVLTVFWQSNKFISPLDSCLYIIAGYGQLQYKNMVQRYHFPTGKWDTVKTSGDFFMPRYLAALGTNLHGDTAYILGGYGSNTGDQTINPKNSYELLGYSVLNKSFKVLAHLKEPARQFCFANSMIPEPGTDNFYALTYPNDRFSSGLQLIKGSLHNENYELMADSIPYSFYDVESFADLYYAPAAKKLIAVTLNMQKNNTTVIKAYTLDFPPNAVEVSLPVTTDGDNKTWIYVTTAAILAGLLYLLLYKNRKKVVNTPASEKIKEPLHTSVPFDIATSSDLGSVVHPALKEHSAVFLFGQFEVFDKDGHDITPLFTPLLKELFLLILIYTFKDGKGISPEKLFEILWSDKSSKDARNNYSVNSVKLKPILEKIGDCHIGRESGKLRFEISNNAATVDYQRFMELISGKHEANKLYALELVNLLQRGNFLSQQHYNWLDDIKSEVSGAVIDTLLKFLEKLAVETDAEFISKTANVIFLFDQLNEEALTYKCRALIFLGRHGLAKDAYTKFTKEYRENYAQDFDRSFVQVSGSDKSAGE